MQATPPPRRWSLRWLGLGVVLAVVMVVVDVVAGQTGSKSASGQPTKTLSIVVGENFWGSLVSQLAGKAGTVTSIVSDPNADPHDYETSSNDARAFASADYVVLNGAGYDTWADKLLGGNPNSKRRVLTVAALLSKHEGDNPHFWYDPASVSRVMDQIESDLKSLDPADAGYFDNQRGALDTAMEPSRRRLGDIKAKYTGTPVASTESIIIYLGQYLGLNVISPPEFMQAVAEGNDPPAPSVAQFQTQLRAKQAKVLVYNKQTSTAITTNLRKQAASGGIPLVGITETIQPPTASYEQWFDAELVQLESALAAGARTK